MKTIEIRVEPDVTIAYKLTKYTKSTTFKKTMKLELNLM